MLWWWKHVVMSFVRYLLVHRPLCCVQYFVWAFIFNRPVGNDCCWWIICVFLAMHCSWMCDTAKLLLCSFDMLFFGHDVIAIICWHWGTVFCTMLYCFVVPCFISVIGIISCICDDSVCYWLLAFSLLHFLLCHGWMLS